MIVGQGIAGTWLSYWFGKMGADVMVFDEPRPNTATRVASGVINPVTGRQAVTTWMADTLLPFAGEAYTIIGEKIGAVVVKDCGILSFPPSEQMEQSYLQRMAESPTYVQRVPDSGEWGQYFRFMHGAVQIKPAFWVDLQTLLTGWRKWLLQSGSLCDTFFDENLLQVGGAGVSYQGHTADYIFYCDGVQCARSKYWDGLPFSFNKGEALIAEIPGLPYGRVYKFGVSTLVPWQGGQWWVGSTYDNRFTHEAPSDAFRTRTEQFLEMTLKLPFVIKGHHAAIRPSTLERRPFAGLHPNLPRVGILGGLGTKGVSLSPWLAKQLAGLVLHGGQLVPEANVQRFKRAFL